jgi:hypothetical protein
VQQNEATPAGYEMVGLCLQMRASAGYVSDPACDAVDVVPVAAWACKCVAYIKPPVKPPTTLRHLVRASGDHVAQHPINALKPMQQRLNNWDFLPKLCDSGFLIWV